MEITCLAPDAVSAGVYSLAAALVAKASGLAARATER